MEIVDLVADDDKVAAHFRCSGTPSSAVRGHTRALCWAFVQAKVLQGPVSLRIAWAHDLTSLA
jgi:hypothetical protein